MKANVRGAGPVVGEIRRIGKLAHQTAVHCKKYEFAVAQLVSIADCLEARVRQDRRFTQQETTALTNLNEQMDEIRSMMGHSLVLTWSRPTIKDPSHTVLNQLLAVFRIIHTNICVFDQELGATIEANLQRWMPYHILDLRAITASFIQSVRTKVVGGDVARAVEHRLLSMEKILDEYTAESFAPRVFSPIPLNYQSWLVKYDDYDVNRMVGSGATADVFCGCHKETKCKVAIKRFKAGKLVGSRFQLFQREVAVLATAVHPTLLKLVGATDKPCFSIITEWMPGGSLYDDLRRRHKLNVTQRMIAALDIARGMEFLHSCEIVHRDLKSLNVLVAQDGTVRIGDFGFSRCANDESQMSQGVGTLHWMAPEILSREGHYTAKVDVYAYGILLWELATTGKPYEGLDGKEIAWHVLNRDARPSIPPNISPGMCDLIVHCWDKDPNARPSFSEIVRRIRTMEAIFNGTDIDQFVKYVEEHMTADEQIKRDVEGVLDKVIKGEINIKRAMRSLERTGIPLSVVDMAWDEVQPILEKCDPEDVAAYAALFVKSPKQGEAASCLRQLRPKSVAPTIVSKFIMSLPTGSLETDADIVVMACRNGGAGLAALYANNPTTVELALSVVAENGVDTTLKTAVCDLCVQCVGSGSTNTIVAAMRCLMSLGEVDRIPLETVQMLASSPISNVSACAYITLACIVMQGIVLPYEMFDALATTMMSDERAALCVTLACKDEGCAERLVAMYEQCSPQASTHILKTLVCAGRHKRLRSRVRRVVDNGCFAEKEDLDGIVGLLMGVLEDTDE